MVVKDLCKSTIAAYVYLYCVEKRLRDPSTIESLLLQLDKNFPFSHYLYVVLFHYSGGKQFQALARQN